MSLKPFKKVDQEYIQQVCEQVFDQWRALLKGREVISILLWVGDGSEMIDYTGDLDREFEWAYFMGTANLPLVGELPAETSLHERKQLYMENPPKVTYGILKQIIAAIKAEGRKRYPDAQIRVGETFDIGPEFAISDFKYHRHPESCQGTGCDKFGFVDATALLTADTYPYAAYPGGLPEGTPMGTLLGAQANVFLRDMDFDYLWLSNGMGFCYEPWSEQGKIYDGTRFYPEKLEKTREKIFLFWKLFRDACPQFPIETRGTNYSAGMDYASDGVPLYDIYTGDFNITPPPNSPWAAINDDMGIEILGQLTRNCTLPGKDYMFRFYIHDPWWMNSPWYERYEGNPHDIYIPMALSRIDEDGRTQAPNLFNILTIDNSMGDMPDHCVNEPLPHILKAEKDAPDEAAPLVLVYPMREYTTSYDAQLLEEMYFGDRFLRDALNSGFPLASVVSTDNFAKHCAEGKEDIYRKSVLVVPAAFENEAAKKALAEYASEGGKLIVYGSAAALEQVDYPCCKVDIAGDTARLMEAFAKSGYDIRFEKVLDASPLPTMAVSRSDNAVFFNVYNRDTTVETKLRFPLGAPIINGCNARIENGAACYHFPRSSHGECRVFVKQASGVVRAKEAAPGNRKYRRKIAVSGLENAEVCLFPESYCTKASIVAVLKTNGSTPIAEPGWELVEDPENGVYLRGRNISGEIYFLMPFRDRME